MEERDKLIKQLRESRDYFKGSVQNLCSCLQEERDKVVALEKKILQKRGHWRVQDSGEVGGGSSDCGDSLLDGRGGGSRTHLQTSFSSDCREERRGPRSQEEKLGWSVDGEISKGLRRLREDLQVLQATGDPGGGPGGTGTHHPAAGSFHHFHEEHPADMHRTPPAPSHDPSFGPQSSARGITPPVPSFSSHGAHRHDSSYPGAHAAGATVVPGVYHHADPPSVEAPGATVFSPTGKGPPPRRSGATPAPPGDNLAARNRAEMLQMKHELLASGLYDENDEVVRQMGAG